MRSLAALALAAALLAGCGRAPESTPVIQPAPAPTPVTQAPAPSPPAPQTAQMGAAPAATAPAQMGAATEQPRFHGEPGDLEGARFLAARSLMVPVAGIAPGALTDTYTEARGARTHEALDIPAPAGTPVVAVDNGRIAKLFTSKPGGLTLYLFDADERLAYYYAHLDGYAPGVREGLDVQRGTVLGYVGSTGNANADAPHLHFAVFRLGEQRRWWEGDPVNPYPAMRLAAPAEQLALR